MLWEKNTDCLPLVRALTGNQIHHLLVQRTMLQSDEPHWPGANLQYALKCSEVSTCEISSYVRARTYTFFAYLCVLTLRFAILRNDCCEFGFQLSLTFKLTHPSIPQHFVLMVNQRQEISKNSLLSILYMSHWHYLQFVFL